jgi:hypothetical protein
MAERREMVVTDHAVLRFMERVLNIDVEEIRRAIATPGLVAAFRAGASKYADGNVEYILKDNGVVTVQLKAREAPKCGRVATRHKREMLEAE